MMEQVEYVETEKQSKFIKGTVLSHNLCQLPTTKCLSAISPSS